MKTTLLLLAVCFVAFTNGANANFKGVASLYGGRLLTLRTALYWGTFTTFLGSIISFFLTGEMLKTFTGKGLVSDDLVSSHDFLTAVALGSALTSFLATRIGFPVSTTHALLGGLIGAGYAGSAKVNLAVLGKLFIYPLLASPLLAIILGGLTFLILRRMGWLPDRSNRLIDALHFISTGTASFARGLNDTPKMAALLIGLGFIDLRLNFILIAVMIALGGLLDAKNVAETLGKKVTGMTASQGFASSLVTAGLVATASMHSLPVSTTHVSVGSLTGMGIATRQAKLKKFFEIILAWITTVPCGAVTAALCYFILKTLK